MHKSGLLLQRKDQINFQRFSGDKQLVSCATLGWSSWSAHKFTDKKL